MVTRNRQSGYVALLAVLVTGAATLAIALSLLTIGADSQRSGLAGQQSKQARVLAFTCAQEALQQIHDNVAFTGTTPLTLGQGTCSYTVASTSGTVRTIVATGTVGTVVRKLQTTATVSATTVTATAWQEVP